MRPFPLTIDGVLLQIEQLRKEAGRDSAKLAALGEELERHLLAATPSDPLLASVAHEVLDGYYRLARAGFFPEVRRGDEDL